MHLTTRSALLVPLSLILTLSAFASSAPSQTTPKASLKMSQHLAPEEVQRSAIVIDTHADTPQRVVDEGYDLSDPLNGGNFNLESARKGNLGAEFFSIWVEPEANKGHYTRRNPCAAAVGRHPLLRFACARAVGSGVISSLAVIHPLPLLEPHLGTGSTLSLCKEFHLWSVKGGDIDEVVEEMSL